MSVAIVDCLGINPGRIFIFSFNKINEETGVLLLIEEEGGKISGGKFS